MKKEVESEKTKALKETKSFLEQTRKDIEKLVGDIRKSQASEQSVKGFHRKLKQSEQAVRKMLGDGPEVKSGPAGYRVGDRVEIMSLGKQGEIEKLVGQDRAKIKVGNVYTTVELRNLRKTDSNEPTTKPTSWVSYASDDDAPSPEIQLLGMTSEEAIEELAKFLDRSIVSGLKQVYVVHGKGTGALRRKLTEYLKGHQEVASVRLGDWNEGGAGVTVVRLKD